MKPEKLHELTEIRQTEKTVAHELVKVNAALQFGNENVMNA